MTERTCSVDGCEALVVARGWCRKHYSRWYRHGTVTDAVRPNCSVLGCERPIKARGWCALHYWRWQHNGTVDDPRPRTRSICSVPDCDGFVVGQGWCRLHYSRMYLHGALDLPERPKKPIAACDCDGCNRPAIARGWCSMHYSRWQKFGTALPRGFDAAPGMKWCRACETYKPLTEFYRSSPCKECTRLRAAEKERRRRALKRSSGAEPYTALEIAARDDWRCQICRKAIGRTLKWPHPRSLSIDHIVPISRGGGDTKANVQATHLRCNLSKNRWGIDQLRLIG